MQRWRGGGTLELVRTLAIGRSTNHSFGNNRLHTLHTKDTREQPAKNCPTGQPYDRPAAAPACPRQQFNVHQKNPSMAFLPSPLMGFSLFLSRIPKALFGYVHDAAVPDYRYQGKKYLEL